MRLGDRFWSKVTVSEGCWVWTGTLNRGGYGKFKFQGRMVLAHRHAYELTKGTIPKNMVIDHLCHTKSCINPAHLRCVTVKQNSENRKQLNKNNSSGFRGVSYCTTTGKYVAAVRHNGKRINLGYFDSPEAAAEVASAKRDEVFT